jgi:hypothetical protein
MGRTKWLLVLGKPDGVEPLEWPPPQNGSRPPKYHKVRASVPPMVDL